MSQELAEFDKFIDALYVDKKYKPLTFEVNTPDILKIIHRLRAEQGLLLTAAARQIAVAISFIGMKNQYPDIEGSAFNIVRDFHEDSSVKDFFCFINKLDDIYLEATKNESETAMVEVNSLFVLKHFAIALAATESIDIETLKCMMA